MKTSVSIIVPAYNRSHLIGLTLDSILAQTFRNWECIVVDDGSEDFTRELLGFYTKKDVRIKFYIRPPEKKKGANSCRNFGFKQSIGKYIIWFDSDDLMLPEHIELKLNTIEKGHYDFVIAQTQNFNNKGSHEPYKYEKKPYGIKASDFILLKIHWYTYDVMLKKEIAEMIEWNEKMKSWQDYNYFCKMLLVTENGDYINNILTHRRLHANSIQKNLNKDTGNYNKELLDNRMLTYRDISDKIDFSTRKELLFGMMNVSFEMAKAQKNLCKRKELGVLVKNLFGLKSKFYFDLAILISSTTGRGNYFLDKAKNKI